MSCALRLTLVTRINTPAVIKRVSMCSAFVPYSRLQFLPVGYCIECSTDARDSNLLQSRYHDAGYE